MYSCSRPVLILSHSKKRAIGMLVMQIQAVEGHVEQPPQLALVVGLERAWLGRQVGADRVVDQVQQAARTRPGRSRGALSRRMPSMLRSNTPVPRCRVGAVAAVERQAGDDLDLVLGEELGGVLLAWARTAPTGCSGP